jgi:vacuolar-type H+-ATPase subunit B/Vma2
MVGGDVNGEGKEIDSSYCEKLERWVDLVGKPANQIERKC